jgi:hypothetical protein
MKRRVIFFAGVLLAGMLGGVGVFHLFSSPQNVDGKEKSASESSAVSLSAETGALSVDEGNQEPVVKKPESVQVFRLGFAGNGAHYFTADRSEKEQLEEQGWTYEGVAFEAPP